MPATYYQCLISAAFSGFALDFNFHRFLNSWPMYSTVIARLTCRFISYFDLKGFHEPMCLYESYESLVSSLMLLNWRGQHCIFLPNLIATILPILVKDRLSHISGPIGPTEMVHLSKFVEFNKETNNHDTCFQAELIELPKFLLFVI